MTIRSEKRWEITGFILESNQKTLTRHNMKNEKDLTKPEAEKMMK